MTEKKTLVLLDVHAIIHRAYHALPDFSTSKGEPTGALYGLSTMLLKIISDLKPDYIVACYDLPKPTYRHEAYKDYKAGRAKADEELISQLKRSYDIFSAFNIPVYSKEGFEADDMIGTIVEKVKDKKDLNVIIASGDMDTLQLVDEEKVSVYTLKKGIKDTILYNEKSVFERFGFSPKLLADYKGLRGDPSDNIVGIKGIGEKTASELIQKIGSIEDIYKTLKEDKKKLLDIGIKERIVTLLEENEEEAIFSKMLGTIRKDAPIEFSIPEKTWKESLDIEKISGVWTELEFRTLGSRLKDVLSLKSKTQSIDAEEKEDQITRPTPEKQKEMAVMLWLLNSNITNPTLDDIYSFTKTKDPLSSEIFLSEEIEKKGLKEVWEKIEKPLLKIIPQMKEVGIKIDKTAMTEMSVSYHSKLSELERKIWEMSGIVFNINSPKQLGEVLYNKLALKPKNQRKTSGGSLSTKESELEKMKDMHPVVSLIFEYRELQKLLSTYIDVIPNLLDEKDRLHANFLQTGTTTGRMASSDPNLQNIPIRTDLGKSIRKAFIAEKDFKLVSFDYSQIELRIAAFLSKDKKLIEIFRKGEDVHTAVASEVFGVPLDKVDKEMRRRAKVINFGIMYGMGVNALRQNLGTDRKEAQAFYDEYFKKFDGLAKYLDETKADAMRRGYTETFFGRRRYFEGLNSKIPFIKAMTERMAINAPIQGTEADLVKLAMVKIESFLEKKKLKEEVRLLLQVHDELVYEISDKEVEKVSSEIKKIMEGLIPPEKIEGIVCKTDVAVGDNWLEMKEI